MRRAVDFCRSRIGIKLWGALMVMITIGAATMWIGQIFLVEPSYEQGAFRRVIRSVEPLVRPGDVIPESSADALLSKLSEMIFGIAMIYDRADDRVVKGFSLGREGYPDPGEAVGEEELASVVDLIRSTEVDSYSSGSIELNGARILHIAISVRYSGRSSLLMLISRDSEIDRVSTTNRRQLIVLTIIMMLGASIEALSFARTFTRPLYSLRSTLSKLADGDLSAEPDVHRRDEIGALASSVSELASSLRSVDVLRRELFANVSHELKTPIAVMTGYAEMIRDVTSLSADERCDALDLIISEGSRMNKIINDILDYSSIEAGSAIFRAEEVELCSFVRSEAEQMRGAAARYGIMIDLVAQDEEFSASFDPMKISHVMRNLLNNAIDRTPDGSTITVEISRRGDARRVSVINEGPQIPEESRSKIWERYSRIEGSGARRQGSGIGLSLVAKILDAHSFARGVDSRDGVNRFWFDVPAKRR